MILVFLLVFLLMLLWDRYVQKTGLHTRWTGKDTRSDEQNAGLGFLNERTCRAE